MSLYSLALRKTAFTLNLPPTIYVSGSSIRGELELDYEAAFEDNIDRIYVQLQGTIQTKNRLDAEIAQFKVETSDFLQVQHKLWSRLNSALPRNGNCLRLPFELQIPPDAPPSFGFESYMNQAYVRYSLNVVGVRMGTFAINRTIEVPLVVVIPDPIGSAVRSQLKIGWQHDWGRVKAEANLRRFPWGEYSQVKMELLVPHMDIFPLFTNIPYIIIITTVSASVKRKDMAPPERNLFPPMPRGSSEIDFELRRFVEMPTLYKPSNPEEHVADIIAKAHAPLPPVDTDFGEYMWLPDSERPERGWWRQEATFHSHMNLRFTPTFLTEEVKIKYTLELKVKFPGLGNVVHVELPINIGSGMETSLPIEQPPMPPRMVDLPSSYWNPSAWEER